MKSIFILLIIGILWGCNEKRTSREDKLENNENKGWYFEMDHINVDSLFQKLEKIKINDSIDVILKILGKPDYDQISSTKETNRFSNRELCYYTKKKNKDLININDELISIYLNSQNHVFYIESNVINHILKKGEYLRNR